MYEDIRKCLRGINAINITPFREDYSIDFEALGRNLDDLINHGIDVIYPCGNTGEYYSLTCEEARAVVEFTVCHIAGRAKVMVGIGHDAYTAAKLAAHAEQTGADGLMLHQPVHPIQSEAGMLAYYREVAAATKLPIVLYVRHECVSAEMLKEAAAIPNIIGVKYAVNYLPAFAQAVRLIGDELVWICGTAEMWAPFFFAAGAVGFTSGMVNVDAARSIAMLDLLRQGSYGEAMGIWDELRLFEELRERNKSANNVSVVKEAMAQLGLGNSIVRPPIAQLSEADKVQVRRILHNWGLL